MSITAPTEDQQLQRLHDLMRDSAGWEVCVVLHRCGDTPFLASPAPKLRGYEIVSASPEFVFDIWKRSKGYDPRPVKFNLTKAEVAEWLSERTPPEAEFLSHGKEWLEDLMAFYNIPRRISGGTP